MGKIERYISTLLKEIDSRKNFIQHPDTLYIGGGTPSLLQPSYIKMIVEKISEIYFDGEDLSKHLQEFTIEVNPDDINGKYVQKLLSFGVNRVSMGIQSFDDRSLKWMNRRHTSEEGKSAFNILRSEGVGNISIDLIFGYRPDNLSDEELLGIWGSDINCAINLRPNHISAYQMSLEGGSKLNQLYRAGKYVEPDQDICCAEYSLLQERCESGGYYQYEISNFAMLGFKSKHNSAYWDRKPYIGFGASAHSFSGRVRSWNPSKIDNYFTNIEDITLNEKLSDENILDEVVMLGLRKVEGFDLNEIESRYRGGIRKRAIQLADRGLLNMNGDKINIPREKLFISEYIIRELLTD